GAWGSATWGNGSGGLTGTPNDCNSVLGSTPQVGIGMVSTFTITYDYLIVGFPLENRVTIFRPSTQELAQHHDSAMHGLSSNATSAIPFVDPASCRIVASVFPVSPDPLTGDVTAVAFVDN